MLRGETLFRIGNVELSGFDAPEVLGDLGGKQVIVFHRFPGGYISAQLFGRYPEEISCTQEIDGPDAINIIKSLDDLVDAGPVVLQYAGWNFLGLVEHVRIDAKEEQRLKYTLTFKPVQRDATSVQSTGLAGQDLLAAALNQASQQVAAPSSQYQFSNQIQSGVQNLQASSNSTLSGYQGNLYNVPAGTAQSLQSQIGTLRNQLTPLLNGTDSAAASAAADLMNSLRHVELALDQSVDTLRQVDVMNPNLFELAATYYGDASKWDLIRDANPDLGLDPQPTGNFKLTIPEDPGRASASVSTFL